MNYKKTIKYWAESADYDFVTALGLLNIKRFPYALFFIHLAIEKLLKAIVVKNTKKHAPTTHSLVLLAKKTTLEIPDELLDKLAEYSLFNIEARYPDERREFYAKCTDKFTTLKIKEAEEVFRWFQKKLNQ